MNLHTCRIGNKCNRFFENKRWNCYIRLLIFRFDRQLLIKKKGIMDNTGNYPGGSTPYNATPSNKKLQQTQAQVDEVKRE